jgi:hypothetical protein
MGRRLVARGMGFDFMLAVVGRQGSWLLFGENAGALKFGARVPVAAFARLTLKLRR